MLMAMGDSVHAGASMAEKEIANFFTFRAGQPGYSLKRTDLKNWGWLSLYPQNVYFASREDYSANRVEQMTVGVCQNYDYVNGVLSAMNGMIIGGANYGQGSSREHAALVPLYLGIRAVIAKSFSRIHMANLINAGILPLTFANEADYELVSMGDKLTLTGVRNGLLDGKMTLLAGENQITLTCSFTDRQRDILLAGGLLPYTKAQKENR